MCVRLFVVRTHVRFVHVCVSVDVRVFVHIVLYVCVSVHVRMS